MARSEETHASSSRSIAIHARGERWEDACMQSKMLGNFDLSKSCLGLVKDEFKNHMNLKKIRDCVVCFASFAMREGCES